jgi:hypothetical protein
LISGCQFERNFMLVVSSVELDVDDDPGASQRLGWRSTSATLAHLARWQPWVTDGREQAVDRGADLLRQRVASGQRCDLVPSPPAQEAESRSKVGRAATQTGEERLEFRLVVVRRVATFE